MTSQEDVNVTVKIGADLSGGVQSREELARIRAEAKRTTAESSTGFNTFGKSVEGVSKAAGLFGKILSGFGVIGVFTSLVAGLEKISSLFSENAGKARELKDAARAEELTKSVGDLADAYAKVKQELQEAAKEQNNALELIDAEVKARRDLRNAEIDASEQKELAAIDANAEDAAERKAVIQAKYQHIRETGTASPTFHIYHKFRSKNHYIFEKQSIIFILSTDFVLQGSVVKIAQKSDVERCFGNNSRERGKSG